MGVYSIIKPPSKVYIPQQRISNTESYHKDDLEGGEKCFNFNRRKAAKVHN